MPDDRVEQLLRSLPVQTLAPDAEHEIVAAVRAAGQSRRVHWWQRRIPIWGAAAACLLVCLATWFATGWRRTEPVTGNDLPPILNAPSVFVRLDRPLFRQNEAPANKIDTSRWRVLDVQD